MDTINYIVDIDRGIFTIFENTKFVGNLDLDLDVIVALMTHQNISFQEIAESAWEDEQERRAGQQDLFETRERLEHLRAEVLG